MLEDYQLIIRIHRGDSDALRQIYHKYKDALYTTALTLLNDCTSADNALHDAFVTFAQRVPGLAIYKSAKVYLAGYIIAQSQTILKRKMYKVEEVPRTFCSLTDNSADTARQHTSAVMDAMTKVPQPQREALVLYLYAGLNFSEIARVQRISTTVAKDRYRYGLEKLTGILDKLVENLTEQDSIEDKLKKVRCVTSAELDEQILSDSQAQFERASKVYVGRARLIITTASILIALIICAIILAVLLSERKQNKPPVVAEQIEIAQPNVPQPEIAPAPKLPENTREQRKTQNDQQPSKLERIEIMAATGNVVGLAAVLQTGDLESKLTGIKLLSRMSDPRAAQVLNDLAAGLDTDNPQDHLLAQALGVEDFGKPDEEEIQETEIAAEPNEQDTRIDRLDEQYVTGWLIDENGYALDGKIYVGQNEAAADANGMFSIQRPSFENFISSFGYAIGSDAQLGVIFHWNQYDDLNDIEIVCMPLLSASGLVVDANNQPLSDFQMQIVPEANAPSIKYGFDVPWKFSVAADGSFDVNSIPPGYPLELIISRDDLVERVPLGDTGFEMHMLLEQIILESVIESEPNSSPNRIIP